MCGAESNIIQKMLILGMGNSIISDDRIGLYIVEKLKDVVQNPQIEIKTLEAGGLDILDALLGFDAAIVIDAIKTGRNPPGTIQHFTPEQYLSPTRNKAVHDMSFFDAMRLGSQMNLQVPERIDILAVEVTDNQTIGERISPEVLRSADPVIEKVIKLVEESGMSPGQEKAGIQDRWPPPHLKK